jgi:predicted permease
MAIRTALGAGRWRVVRQLLTESTLLAFGGGALGLFLADWGLALLRWLSPGNVPRLIAIEIDGRVLAFTTALAVLTGILFGLAPALRSSRVSLSETLKEGGRTMVSGHHRLRDLLVITEIALSLVLLIGAGLLIHSFLRVEHVEPGFAAQNVLSLRLAVVGPDYEEEIRRVNYYHQLSERVRVLPGVEAAGFVSVLPLAGAGDWGRITIDGYDGASGQDMIQADGRIAGVGYFETMRIPILRGRLFTEQDTKESVPVAVIDENMARTYWPNEDPVGKRLKGGGANSKAPWLTVVGVVGNVKQSALDTDTRVSFYTAHLQESRNTMYLVVRTTAATASVAAAVTREARALEPNVPVYDVKTMEQRRSASLARRGFAMLMLGLFALVAMLLAAVGIYGVMSYTVQERAREIGIRVALGARTRDVLNLVVRRGISLAAVGVGIGLGCAVALTRVMASLLFGVGATDPLTFAVVALVLMLVALLACYIPARRAAKVDPMVALRYE